MSASLIGRRIGLDQRVYGGIEGAMQQTCCAPVSASRSSAANIRTYFVIPRTRAQQDSDQLQMRTQELLHVLSWRASTGSALVRRVAVTQKITGAF
jgi:hypothetical protein